MPYYLESDDREELKKLLKYQVCAECGSKLGAFYDIQKHLPYLQCRVNPEHEGIEREASRYEKEGLASLTIKRRNEIMENEYGKDKTTALARLPTTGALTQSQAMHILKLVYPDVPEDQIIRTAILCRDFGLHPLMKEVYIIGFKNNKTGRTDYSTVIGITASRKMAADKKGAYSFIDRSPRAATSEEIIKQYGKGSEEERDNLISICILKGQQGNEAMGFGLWPKDKEPYGMDKGNTKRNMANIRSERQAIDRLPGEKLPPLEAIDEAYAELPDVGKVDIKTGEIIDSEAIELETEPQPKQHWCEEHGCAFELKTSRFGKFYAHKLLNGKWCNEKKKEAVPEPAPEDVPSDESREPSPNTIEALKETMQLCNWSAMETGHFCNVEKQWNIRDFTDLTPEQITELIGHIKQNSK